MKHLVSVPFNKVQKGRFKELVNRTVAVVEKYELSYYEEVYNNLKAVQKDADRLDISVRKSITTEELQDLRKEQRLLVGTLVQHNKTVKKMKDDDLMEYVRLTCPFIDKHLGSSLRVCDSDLTTNVAKLFFNMDSDEALKEALSATWYDRNLTKLRPINEKIIVSTTDRNTVKSKRLTFEESREIMNVLKDALLNLFRGIELAVYLNPSVDFKDLIKELNNMLKEFRTPILANDTRNKNAALEETLKSTSMKVTDTKVQPSETDTAATKLPVHDKIKAA